MLLNRFKDWAKATVKANPTWSLEFVTRERDGIIVSCEAWFNEGGFDGPDVAQGYWRIDPVTEIIDCATF